MATVSSVKPQFVPPSPPPQKVGRDSDGDNDGSKGAAVAKPAPQVPNPTATLGNHVNTLA